MTFVRTVLGDIDPAEMGVTYAHEHLVIDGGRPVDMSPDFLLADVIDGIDERDYGGPIVRRTVIRAGVVKVGGSEGGPSRRDVPIFRAAAATHARTGAPVHTHCEAGTGALEQIRTLVDCGGPPRGLR